MVSKQDFCNYIFADHLFLYSKIFTVFAGDCHMTANTHYRELSSLSQSDGPKRRGEYIKITAKDQAVIGEYAANGTCSAICSFKRGRSVIVILWIYSFALTSHSFTNREVPDVLTDVITTYTAA